MKITNRELFRNALKIILVGTGNVLSPHKYFQFERTLKNVVMKDLGIKEPPLGGPHEGGTLEGAAPPSGSTCHPFMPFMPFMCDIKCGHFAFFHVSPTPWFFL